VNTILITGVGGGVGQSIVKCLQGRYRLVGVDEFALAAGLYAVDQAYIVPPPKDPRFIDCLLEIARAEGCSIVFPGLDPELAAVAAAADRFREHGIHMVISSPEVVDLSDDKLGTAQFLAKHGFPAPRTQMLSDPVEPDMPFPVVLKPRKGGARSRGIHVARNAAEVDALRPTLPADNYVVQEQIEGDEYTCGTVNIGGTCGGVITMRRTLRNGDTYKAFVTKDEQLAAFVKSVADVLQPFGACNFQLRLRDGKAYIFEFNARCSGTTHCRALAGFNEPELIAEFLLNGVEPQYTIREISVLRYWNELTVDNADIARLERDHTLAGGGRRL
jgi:carbamoyl-phosphate synthase large subunit